MSTTSRTLAMARTLPSQSASTPGRAAPEAAAMPSSATIDPACRATEEPPPGHPELLEANPGDHPSIHRFLHGIFRGPSAAEFQAQLDEPAYEPMDRLIVRHGSQIVAHLRVTRRDMNFGCVQLPIAGVHDVATALEYRGHGFATALMQASEHKMRQEGAIVALLRTGCPKFYARLGWAPCARHSYSLASPREILARIALLTPGPPPRPLEGDSASHQEPLGIRLWRRVEQDALCELYARNTHGQFGPLARDDAYWRWLINRRGYDRIYVAIHGSDRLDLEQGLPSIVGYAAVKQGRIHEMMTNGEERVAIGLLARCAADAIERDCQPVIFHGPPGHPLHELIAGGQGEYHGQLIDHGDVHMAKLLAPMACLERLSPLFFERARAAGWRLPCELGLAVGDARYHVVVSRRAAHVATGKLGRSFLTLSPRPFTQLLLGHLDVADACLAGRITASTRVALQLAATLFPLVPLWLPPFDDLPA